MGVLNPLQYRGYVYDFETGYYYLQSRYYDPEIGRFINADGLVATGQGMLGNNMFAYCGNNPVLFEDISGHAYKPSIVIINDGAGGDYGPIGIIGSDYYHNLNKMNMHANEVHGGSGWFQSDEPSYLTITDEGVGVLSSSTSIYRNELFADTEENRELFFHAGNIDTYVGAHFEKGVGIDAGAELFSIGYQGDFIGFSVNVIGLGTTYMYKDGVFDCGITAGLIGVSVSVDVVSIIEFIFGG